MERIIRAYQIKFDVKRERKSEICVLVISSEIVDLLISQHLTSERRK